jgi:hypothetical protein
LEHLLGIVQRDERPLLLLVASYPVERVWVPDIKRKPPDRIATVL